MMWKSQIVLAHICGLLLCLAQIKGNPIGVGNKDVVVEFIILHNNDMHARFEQTSVDSGKCTPELANTNKCYGGFARVAHEVRKFRQEAREGGKPVLYLNAGDTYTGTPWFTVFKDNITAAFLNKLQPDAISLGNHEFDENVAGLAPFLNKVTFPVLATNLDVSKEPELAKAKHFYKSTVLDVRGTKVGVIGYLTPETKFLTVPNEVEFLDEVVSINEEAARLKNLGVNIIIALGHSGYQRDQEIAMNCPEVDLVIGGHTNTFLYNGEQPDAERIDGPYPTVVKQHSGKEVPVVQAYAYTKYLGKLHVQFDKNGNLIEFDGTPLLLNADIPRDDDLLQLLEVYRPNITALESNVIGHTKVHLEGRAEICRSGECNLGNLVADSMVYARILEDLGGSYWTDAPIAFIQGGGIRSSIGKRSDGSILATDVLSVLPFGNDLYMTRITGKTILKALEHSASMEAKDSNGGFLQMSGVHTVYDYNKPIGSRVISTHLLCSECKIPAYEPLQQDKFYNVIVQKFLIDGGDGHTFVEENGTEPIRLQKNDFDALLQYLTQREFVYPEVEERITIIEKKDDGGNDGNDGNGNDGAMMSVSSSIFLVAVMTLLTVNFTN
ncbi:protein 5NUC-like [Lucilia sericata]|uniref:protein 5NUC-like n=1 Tax=Lucilia sericata TaxID=13632 RepID=UPI0018A7EEA3|nr:protein 5NUC-like [Lucilia sericata]